MIDVESLRRDFPELEGGLVYLDNAASTLKPRQVVEAMASFALRRYANVHRGIYRLAAEATKAYEDAHETVAGFIGARPEEVVFTSGTTGSLHLVALLAETNGLVSGKGRIVVPGDAHHSLLLSMRYLARKTGAALEIIPVDGEGVPRWDLLDEVIDADVELVAVTHVSNVTGYESPVEWIARRARKAGALVLVDGAQSVPHIPVNPRELGVDFLAFSGHKMLGPTGIGVLWIREELARTLEPPIGGGGTVRDVSVEDDTVRVEWDDPPMRFEAGTPPIIEAVGLARAVEYLESIGMDAVATHESKLVEALVDELARVGEARIVGPQDPRKRRGIVSFTISGHDIDLVAIMLGQRGIAVRSGHHCAIPLHKSLGIPAGSIRASLYIYNDEGDIERLAGTLREILRG